MARERFSHPEVLKRRQKTSEMYLSGITCQEIAERLSVSVSTASRDVKWLHRYWQSRSRPIWIRRLLIPLAARFEHLVSLYWEGWRRLLVEKETKTALRTNPGNGEWIGIL